VINKVYGVIVKNKTKQRKTLTPRGMGKVKRLKLVFKTRLCCLLKFR
jgi:hypothetical protein